MRAMGKVLFDDTTVSNPIAEEAKKRQRQTQEELRARREARAQRPLLNRDRYPNLYAKWLEGKAKGYSRQPKCPVCREATLHWDEPAHECEGFKPMFVEHDEESRERMEAKREAIREARFDPERLMELRHARMEMIREARLNGELYGMEEDYCEGEDDGYECEDDGVYGDDDGWDCD
jgi:hypothetical protein